MIWRRIAIALIALQCVGLTQSYAATPTAKPHSKVSTVKKRVEKHHSYRASKRKPVQPSPASSWPPRGFTSVGTVFARVPTGTELVGILSAMSDGAEQIRSCAVDPKSSDALAHSCAAILVGSTEHCTWWKISATVTGIDPANSSGRISLGDISVMQPGAAAKTIQTIFLVSPVPLQRGVRFSAIRARCGIGPSSTPVPSTTFTPTPNETPPPTVTPTPTPSPSTP